MKKYQGIVSTSTHFLSKTPAGTKGFLISPTLVYWPSLDKMVTVQRNPKPFNLVSVFATEEETLLINQKHRTYRDNINAALREGRRNKKTAAETLAHSNANCPLSAVATLLHGTDSMVEISNIWKQYCAIGQLIETQVSAIAGKPLTVTLGGGVEEHISEYENNQTQVKTQLNDAAAALMKSGMSLNEIIEQLSGAK